MSHDVNEGGLRRPRNDMERRSSWHHLLRFLLVVVLNKLHVLLCLDLLLLESLWHMQRVLSSSTPLPLLLIETPSR